MGFPPAMDSRSRMKVWAEEVSASVKWDGLVSRKNRNVRFKLGQNVVNAHSLIHVYVAYTGISTNRILTHF